MKLIRISNRYRWFRRYGISTVPRHERQSFPPSAPERYSLSPVSLYPSALRRALLDFRAKIREYGSLFSRVFSGIRQGAKFRPPRRPSQLGQFMRNRRRFLLLFRLPPSYFRRYSRKNSRRGGNFLLPPRIRVELRQDLLLVRLGFGGTPRRARLALAFRPLLFDGAVPARWDSSAGVGTLISPNPRSPLAALNLAHGAIHRLRRNFSYLRFPTYMEMDRTGAVHLIYRTPAESDSYFPFFFRPHLFFSLR